MAVQSKSQLPVLTFNLLAPCYKRLYTGAGEERRDRERHHPDLWRPRLHAILRFLLSITPAPHVVALQEVWFHNPFLTIFEEVLNPHYHIFYAKRPASKEDGLAILVLRSSKLVSNPVHVESFTLVRSSDRVGLAVEVTLKPRTPTSAAKKLLIVNAHLTFPHNFISSRLRQEQAYALARFVHNHAAKSPHVDISALVLGDFNGDALSKAACTMRHAGFTNCYVFINGDADRPTTHYNHNHEHVFVDHMFLKHFQPRINICGRRLRIPEDPSDSSDISDDSSSDENAAARTNIPSPPHAVVTAATRKSRSNSTPPQPHVTSPSPVAIRDIPPDSPISPSELVKRCLKPSVLSLTSSIRPVKSVVYPESLPRHVWPTEFDISDHRPVAIFFATNV